MSLPLNRSSSIAVAPACVSLMRDPATKYGTRIKLDKAWYHGKLLDFHKSNPLNAVTITDHRAAHPRSWFVYSPCS